MESKKRDRSSVKSSEGGRALRELAKKADLMEYHARKLSEHTTEVCEKFGRTIGLGLVTAATSKVNAKMMKRVERLADVTPMGMCMGFMLGTPQPALADKSRFELVDAEEDSDVEVLAPPPKRR
jgi:hypothetical protein